MFFQFHAWGICIGLWVDVCRLPGGTKYEAFLQAAIKDCTNCWCHGRQAASEYLVANIIRASSLFSLIRAIASQPHPREWWNCLVLKLSFPVVKWSWSEIGTKSWVNDCKKLLISRARSFMLPLHRLLARPCKLDLVLALRVISLTYVGRPATPVGAQVAKVQGHKCSTPCSIFWPLDWLCSCGMEQRCVAVVERYLALACWWDPWSGL